MKGIHTALREQMAVPAATPREGNMPTVIISTCMYCMRIRGSNGDWIPVTKDLLQVEGIALSHSLCPQCARIHHPESVPPNSSDAQPPSA